MITDIDKRYKSRTQPVKDLLEVNQEMDTLRWIFSPFICPRPTPGRNGSDKSAPIQQLAISSPPIRHYIQRDSETEYTHHGQSSGDEKGPSLDRDMSVTEKKIMGDPRETRMESMPKSDTAGYAMAIPLFQTTSSNTSWHRQQQSLRGEGLLHGWSDHVQLASSSMQGAIFFHEGGQIDNFEHQQFPSPSVTVREKSASIVSPGAVHVALTQSFSREKKGKSPELFVFTGRSANCDLEQTNHVLQDDDDLPRQAAKDQDAEHKHTVFPENTTTCFQGAGDHLSIDSQQLRGDSSHQTSFPPVRSENDDIQTNNEQQSEAFLKQNNATENCEELPCKLDVQSVEEASCKEDLQEKHDRLQEQQQCSLHHNGLFQAIDIEHGRELKCMLHILSAEEASYKEDLREKRNVLQEQRQRCLRHDGHFQVMDDERSRDKLVKRYKHLYDEADIYSQRLEEAFSNHTDNIEEVAGRLFIEILKLCFDESRKFFLQLHAKILSCVRENLQINSSPDMPSAFDRGLVSLMKELLRESKTTNPPHQLFETIEDEVGKLPALKEALRLSEDRRQSEDSQRIEITDALREVSQRFTKKVIAVSWFLQTLPNSFELDSEMEKFDENQHERHSLSNPRINRISECLWPTLLLKCDAGTKCLCKGIVITCDKTS